MSLTCGGVEGSSAWFWLPGRSGTGVANGQCVRERGRDPVVIMDLLMRYLGTVFCSSRPLDLDPAELVVYELHILIGVDG